ncbi:ERF family protein [Cryobacterium sp. 10S3]|uniref:ERF family protein n=1 Tax=Cryobacterium sp. 10S3 TaxID=3048582 RepID=UPI002AC90DC0|nr:ERF family protein [Cryobacterium sp. 10S3]MEB0287208.1 ERF family protein [Cryobacterium sp. 10S3]WPX14163.1 ERF family protein [Cryobacterium sp. 10S3]
MANPDLEPSAPKKHADYLVPPIIAKALIAVQKELSALTKSAENDAYGSNYVPLDVVTETAHHLLAARKIAVMQPMVTDDQGHAALETILVYEDGRSFSRTTKLAMSKIDPQSHGSAVTYTRRYALMAMIGLTAKDEDDDGNKAANTLAPVRQEQLDSIRMLLSLIPWPKEQIDKAVRSIRTADAADLAVAKYERITSEIKRDQEAITNADATKIPVKSNAEAVIDESTPAGTLGQRIKALNLRNQSFENKVVRIATKKPKLSFLKTDDDFKALDLFLTGLESGVYHLEPEFYAPSDEPITVEVAIA